MKKFNVRYCPNRQWRKLLLTMKFVWIFILAGLLAANAETYSQSTRLDLKMQNATLKSILNEIEERSDYYFFYKNEEIENLTSVSFEVKQASIAEVLDKLLKNEGFKYEIYDRYILIQKKGESQSVADFLQQQITVSGRVVDSSGQPLPGVTVAIKGTAKGTITSIDGNFSLSEVPANATLVFSFVGMTGQEIALAGRARLNVTLQEETIGLEEVIAVGYGTMKKLDVSGSIVSAIPRSTSICR